MKFYEYLDGFDNILSHALHSIGQKRALLRVHLRGGRRVVYAVTELQRPEGGDHKTSKCTRGNKMMCTQTITCSWAKIYFIISRVGKKTSLNAMLSNVTT